MLNKVLLIGRLGADPEIRYTPAGKPVTTFRLATSERWTDKAGNRQERTEWHRVVVFGRLAEICGEHLEKGRLVYVEGALRTRSWENREGNRRYTTEVIAQSVYFLNGGKEKEDSPGAEDAPPSEENLPF